MKKVFILGAGFSKAISPDMPVLSDLSKMIKSIITKLPGDKDIYSKLCDDPESFLTYLSQPMPWKTPESIHIDKASFYILSRYIAEFIQKCEWDSFQSKPLPDWSLEFIKYLHEKASTIATLNYDTLIERLLINLTQSQSKFRASLEDIYPLPIIPISNRTIDNLSLRGDSPISSFKLLKLHGSTNWYYPGEDGIHSQQIYYESVYTTMRPDHFKNKIDLTPLILPPIADKTNFYNINLLKSMWGMLRVTLVNADEIYCIGYSLPKTDLTMGLFLSSLSLKDKTVYIVNNAQADQSEKLLERYKEVFTDCNLSDKYLKSDCIESMVNDITSKNG